MTVTKSLTKQRMKLKYNFHNGERGSSKLQLIAIMVITAVKYIGLWR